MVRLHELLYPCLPVYASVYTTQIKIWKDFSKSQAPSCPFQSTPSPKGNRYSDLHHHRLLLPFLVLYINGTIEQCLVSGFFYSIFLRCICIIMCSSRCFFFLSAEQYSIAWIYHNLSFIRTMDVWVVSSLRLLWTGIVYLFLYFSFGERTYAFLLGVYTGEELMGHRAYTYLALVGIAKPLQKWFY